MSEADRRDYGPVDKVPLAAAYCRMDDMEGLNDE